MLETHPTSEYIMGCANPLGGSLPVMVGVRAEVDKHIV